MNLKKITAFLSAAAAALAMMQALPASAQEPFRLTGDLDYDYLVTANDAQLALNLYAESLVGNQTNTATDDNYQADIDMDGIVDVMDAQNILNYFCLSMLGEQPLWADLRELSDYISYHDGSEYLQYSLEEHGFVPQNEPFPNNGMYLEVGCRTAAPGETITIPVYASGLTTVTSAKLFLDPPEGLEPVSISCLLPLGEIKEKDDRVLTAENGLVYLYPPVGSMFWVTIDEPLLPENGIIAEYTYTVPEDAKPGTIYPLHVNAPKTTLFGGENHNGYQYTLLDGVIVVQ